MYLIETTLVEMQAAQAQFLKELNITQIALLLAEDMKKQPLYFLAGTMVNVTYSIMIGLILKIIEVRV